VALFTPVATPASPRDAGDLARPLRQSFMAVDFAFVSLDEYTECIYTIKVRFTWREAKRRTNLKDHGFDFADAEEVFAGPTFTFEDDRFRYAEQRIVTLGLLKGVCVSLVHTETPDRIHIISFRKATKNEQIIFFQSI
jgi:uncharacterized DUF497 family protein